MTTGKVFDIQRFSTHDGPGIRTTVFLKGCPLRCQWCHNPEGLSPEPVLAFTEHQCVHCGACVTACAQGVHTVAANSHGVDRTRCRTCGECVQVCPTRGLEIIGREMTVAEVLGEILRDEPFYKTSGGGMTLSGGEPLAQADFSLELLKAARGRDLHCAVETCGAVSPEVINRVRPWVDLFLFDLKETDPQKHVEFTGVKNDLILANLRALHDAGAAIILRLPLVPGLNERPDHLRAVEEIVHSLPNLKGTERMAYHPLGESKWARLGLVAPRLNGAK